MSERNYERISDLPVGVTPIAGDELVELEQDGVSRKFSMTALAGITNPHEETHQRGGADEIGTLDNVAYGIPYLDADGLIDTRVSDASTTKKGKVQLATSGEVSATKAVTGTDARLSDARAPTAHAEQHIAGTDVIADATVSNSGLMSAADKVKAEATIPEYIPTADQKAALAGTAGWPSGTNPFVTTQDPRLVGGGGGGTTDALVRAWASFFSVFSEEQPTGQTPRKWQGLASHDGDLYASVYNGDIYKMDSAGRFQPTGQTPGNWQGLASHDGDLYAAVATGDIYKMDGVGIFQPTGQTPGNWHGLASHDGDLYASVYGGDIYKMDGSGVFQPTGQASINWQGLASHDGDLYAAANGGDIYKMDGVGIFQPTGQTPGNWRGLASHDGDLYAAAYNDIYKMDGSGVFQPTGQTTGSWRGLASHDGDLYATVYNGDVYLLTTSNPSVNISKSNYTVPISSSFPINGRKVYRRTSAYDGNPVTITPPSGATFEGLASIELYDQYSYVEIERISETVFAIKDENGGGVADEDNTAFGYQSLYSNTTGIGNTAIGTAALYTNTGNFNTAVGTAALRANTIGTQNTAIGYQALYSNTTGNNNTAVGVNALQANTTGTDNTAIGNHALYTNTTGEKNTVIGAQALYSNTTGNNNTAVGRSAGYANTTGSGNIFIGHNAQGSSPTASNQITLGDYQITSLRCAVTTITALSDRRDKKNIEKLEIGLDFVKALNPCGWNYDLRENYPDGKADGSKMKKERNHGFIAQDLQELQEKFKIDLGLVMDDNPDKLETSEGRLLPVLVKAVQELADRLEKLEGVK